MTKAGAHPTELTGGVSRVRMHAVLQEYQEANEDLRWHYTGQYTGRPHTLFPAVGDYAWSVTLYFDVSGEEYIPRTLGTRDGIVRTEGELRAFVERFLAEDAETRL